MDNLSIPCVIDTGSTLSVLPQSFVGRFNLDVQRVSPFHVAQADGLLTINTVCYINLEIGTITQCVKFFIVYSNLPYAIIGLPECKNFCLHIDCVNSCVYQNKILLPLISYKTVPAPASLHINGYGNCNQKHGNLPVDSSQTSVDSDNPQIVFSNENCQLNGLLKKYTKIFAKDKYDIGRINVEPQRIRLTSDLPICLRPYRTSPKEEEEINSQINNLLKAGLIKESNSPYAAPVTLAFKRDEGTKTRLCVDYRKLNAITKNDAEPLPRIDSLLDKLSGAKIFSTLDLASGFWHVPIHSQDTEKLAFVTNTGLYTWRVLPFGIKTGPAIFNRVIRRILGKHRVDFACNYFDDIIVYSSSEEEHYQHLEKLFKICAEENIKLKLSKCNFMKNAINFLGYEIKQGQITPDNVNIESIKKLKPPTNVKELQRFLGSINVYNKFIDNYAKIRQPLNKLLKKNTPWSWTEDCQEKFELLKNILISKPVLQLYNSKLPIHVFVDASQIAVGAVLKQPDVNGVLHPIAYHSRALRKYEQNYTITELECLAIVDALDKFYYYLHGQKFVIHTDHAALVWLKNVKNLRGRLFRWSLKLSMYDYEVKYLKGSTNIEADMLSRHPVSQHLQHLQHSLLLLDIETIKNQQQVENIHGKKYSNFNDVIVICKKGFRKVVVPMSLRKELMQKAHDQYGHPGVQKMLNIISPHYYWPQMTQDISNYVKYCNTCQLNKKPRQKKFGLLQAVPTTDQPFECLSVDTVGGFNYYNSTKKYLHLIIDHATRYVWAFPSKSVTTETYVNCLKQIFNIQVPNKLLSDRNAAFTASRFKKFLRNYNIKQLLTSAHHPQTNGKVERVNQSIVTRLKCKVNSSPSKVPWTKLLEQVINEYNNTPHSVTKFPPAYLLFGTLPFDSPLSENVYPPVAVARELAKERTVIFHNKTKVRYDNKFIKANFEPGDLVIYEEFNYPNTRKLSPTFSGPYKILNKCSEVTFEIDKPNYHTKKPTEIVHSSKLRHYFSPEKLKLAHEQT